MTQRPPSRAKPFETLSPSVRARESALLRDVFELEASAFGEIEQALRVAAPGRAGD